MKTSWPKSSEGHYATIEGAPSSPRPRPEYPKRYYALLFKEDEVSENIELGQVKGWIDAWALSSMENFPSAEELVPMTIEQWEYHLITDDYGISLHLMAKYINGEFYDLR